MISTRALTRDFVVSRTETVHAVRGISLDVGPGELVAVLGPNGAGKTTTLRMLTTLITPTSGTATVAGYDVTTQPSQVRRRIGYVGQGNGAGHSQRVGDELVGQGVIYGLDRRTAKLRAGELLEALELKDLVQRKVSDLSGGQRRRLDVAIGIVGQPDVLFLDEPTTGFDPQARSEFHELVRGLAAEQGTTILLTTHDLDEASKLAHRILVLAAGRIIASGTTAQLTELIAGEDEVRWSVDGQPFRTSTADSTAFVRQLFATYGEAVRELEVRRASLEDTYLTLVREQA